ncbi:hypothetical protein U1Q18_015179, partial [Sarracenia purpurea var. burkii]
NEVRTWSSTIEEEPGGVISSWRDLDDLGGGTSGIAEESVIDLVEERAEDLR